MDWQLERQGRRWLATRDSDKLQVNLAPTIASLYPTFLYGLVVDVWTVEPWPPRGAGRATFAGPVGLDRTLRMCPLPIEVARDIGDSLLDEVRSRRFVDDRERQTYFARYSAKVSSLISEALGRNG